MFDRLWSAYGRVLYALGLLAGMTTFAMMVLVVANAISRFLFNAPVTGAFEITQSMLPILILLSLALTQFREGHIRVVLLTRRLSPFWRRLVLSLAALLGAGFFAWCAYGGWGFAMQSYAMNEQEWGAVRFPIYPVKFIVFLGLALLALQFLFSAVRVWRLPAAGAGLPESEEGI